MELNYSDWMAGFAASVGAAAALASIIGAMRAGVLKKLRLGAFEMEVSPQEREQARAWVRAVSPDDRQDVPFETEQLALYYGQILSHSKVSF